MTGDSDQGSRQNTAAEADSWLGKVVVAGQQFPLSEPPPLVSQRLRGIPAHRRSSRQPVPELVSRPLTSAASPATVRGTRYAPHRRQTVYSADGFDVVLDVEVTEGAGVTLRGQVIPSTETLPVFQATAVTPNGRHTSILGDRFGGFELFDVPPDSAQLELTNDLVVLVVPLGPLLSRR